MFATQQQAGEHFVGPPILRCMALTEFLKALQLVCVHTGTILLLLLLWTIAILSVLAEQAEGVFHKVL